jgi:lysine decarboxylase
MDESLRKDAPLLDAYLSFLETKSAPFTIPGHKQNATELDSDLGFVVDRDVPLYGGLDEIKLTHGVLIKAEALAAQLWSGDWARFSTGGSTHANQALVLALGKPGDKVAISRTSHRSLLSALVLAGLEPLWLYPDIDSATGVPTGIPVSELLRVLPENPIAVLLTEPGYLGTISDLPPLIDAAHTVNIPVIIDAAWGGHFGFHPLMPKHPMQLGADAFVTSVHKALPGYSASALAVAKTDRLDAVALQQTFETTHTTSPAGAPLASIDAVRALLQKHGTELISQLLARVQQFREVITAEFGAKVLLSTEDFAPGRFDPSKLVLRVNTIGGDGIEIEKDLIALGVSVEMADHDTIVLLATIADDDARFAILTQAILNVLGKCSKIPRTSATSLSWKIAPTIAMSMRDAYFAKSSMVDANIAVGRTSADLIAPYPPGVAVLAPGEVITQEIMDGLTQAKSDGVRIAYASDPTLKTYRVVN